MTKNAPPVRRLPPISRATLVAPATTAADPIEGTGWLSHACGIVMHRDFVAWLTSIAANVAVLLILSLFALPLLLDKPVHEMVILPFGEQATDDALVMTEMSDTAEQSAAQATRDKIGLAKPEFEVDTAHDIDAPPMATAPPMPVTPFGNRPILPAGSTLNRPLSIGRPIKPLTDRELGQSDSVESAVDRIGVQMHELLEAGDLMVVWMMDASISLVDDRQRVAERLIKVYGEIDAAQKQRAADAKLTKERAPLLRNSVVAFGGGFAEVVAPTTKLDRVVRAIATIPVDETGEEHVFTALQAVVAKHGRSWKRQILVVIWTDESGDDILLLEPTIALCKAANAKVVVVGPTAVFGSEVGTHAYYPPPNFFPGVGLVRPGPFWLPVKKGPDTAFAERLLWPYWYGSNVTMPDWHDRTFPVNFRGGWYGGADMYHISSGMPPYALTRLARETGGNYTIFDRPDDRGPFTVERMRPYAADYRSAAEIYEELPYCPLRQAVLASVEVTRTPLIWPDRLMQDPNQFRLSLEGGPVFQPVIRGRAQIRPNLKNALANSIKCMQKIELALQPFGPQGMEGLYAQEASPRWRASYDLTCGRLLAQYVRHSELAAVCQLALAQELPEEANSMSGIMPVARIISGPVTITRAEEAERLLRRCVDSNKGTPWAYLAERELMQPLGCEFRIFHIEPPPPRDVEIPVDRPFVEPVEMPRVSIPRL